MLSSESLNQVCAEILASARLNLSQQAQSDGTQLVSLEFREHRGWAFSWCVPQGVEEMTLKHFYYHEAFLADPAKFELFKIELQWRRLVGCDFEFASLGDVLLKELRASNLEELCRKLSQLKGHKVESGSLLDAVTVHNLSQNFKVTV
ncbi:hypothetical protein [Bdellovibrio svalbardensis]|uniref:Uncharacterized protein n=1 Tax=Bdellovibrio svalbardensis TaxID=2972972 RepID=A0ABT6DLV9_9BACT|nr:hypothetical protein [Bdellovibrio svalbardensis]MDG0816123.1 hypothetical protein [Bdellovibrio svalbardensis]